MRVKINRCTLNGVERTFTPRPGLNIIGGSITTGKTTLIRCFRGLFGTNLANFSREARQNITNLSGDIFLGESAFEVVRPFNTNPSAKVSISGDNEATRLPVIRGSNNERTYGIWLLEKLGLPTLWVPTAPTQPDSDTSLLSINDYMMYCYLSQAEIDNSVFGHTNFVKNNKRKYAFEVIYGKFDIEMANLQEQRRNAVNELNRLRNYERTAEEFLSGTPFENRALIQQELAQTISAIEEVRTSSDRFVYDISARSNTSNLRALLLEVQHNLAEAESALQKEEFARTQKEGLVAQLQTQSERLTKAIVAGKYLLDFDFLTCPRCGSSIDPSGTDLDTCYLCHQHPQKQVSQDDLIKEQERIERQISETRELIENHGSSVSEIQKSIEKSRRRRDTLVQEIDDLTRSYVSEQAETIAQSERYRTQLQERKQRLEEYLDLFTRQDRTSNQIQRLELQIQELDDVIEIASNRASEFDRLVSFLDETYRKILEEIKVPSFPNPGESFIDRNTYLPIIQGRRFDELQSQGLKVMVNIAHALAHQVTCINFDLSLPNILFIDGVSGNIGYVDLDLERIQAIYDCIIRLTEKYKDRLQVIVADNTIPENAREYILAEFNESNKLIPLE